MSLLLWVKWFFFFWWCLRVDAEMGMCWIVFFRHYSVCCLYSYRDTVLFWKFFFSKGLYPSLSVSPSCSLSVSLLSLFETVQKSLHILEVIYLVCRSVSPAAVRSESCFLLFPLSLSHTHVLRPICTHKHAHMGADAHTNTHTLSHSLLNLSISFSICVSLQKRRMMQGT